MLPRKCRAYVWVTTEKLCPFFGWLRFCSATAAHAQSFGFRFRHTALTGARFYAGCVGMCVMVQRWKGQERKLYKKRIQCVSVQEATDNKTTATKKKKPKATPQPKRISTASFLCHKLCRLFKQLLKPCCCAPDGKNSPYLRTPAWWRWCLVEFIINAHNSWSACGARLHWRVPAAYQSYHVKKRRTARARCDNGTAG